MEKVNEQQILGPRVMVTVNPENTPSLTMTSMIEDFGGDSHSDFVSSSRQLIEATKKKLMVMNSISNELRSLAGLIKDDRGEENKGKNSADEAKNSTEKTSNIGNKKGSKLPQTKQNIKIVVPVCSNDGTENGVNGATPKSTVRPKGPWKTRPRNKKIVRDSSLAELAKRYCKKNKRSSKLDPLKYLEEVQNSKTKNHENDDKKKQEFNDSDKNDENTRRVSDDATDDAVSSCDDKTPRETHLPVIKITRKSDHTDLTNKNAKYHSNREKRTIGKCHNYIAQAWCEKQDYKLSKQNVETQIRNNSLNKTYLKLCQRQICTRHSIPECNISTIQFETKAQFPEPNGLLSPLSRRLHSTIVPMRSGVITGRLRNLSNGLFQSENMSKEQIPMALTPEKYSCPRLLCFGSERINAEYLTHRQILRPSKVTLQSSDSSEVGFLPIDEISVGFRFKVGGKQTNLIRGPRENLITDRLMK